MKLARQFVVGASVLALACAGSLCQDSSSVSLGEVARAQRADPAKTASKVYTNSDLETMARAEAPEAGDAQDPTPPPASNSAGIPQRGVDAVPSVGMPQDSNNKKKKRAEKDPDAVRDPDLPPPLTLSGTLSAGYYQADSRNGHDSHEGSPVGSVKLDGSGYYHSPDFLKFNIKPQFTLGRQSSENIFPDGQGVAATTTFLGGSFAPFTVSYNYLSRKIVTFGPLDRLAGLDADTSQNALSLNWRIRRRNLPELVLDYSKFSDSYKPLEDLAPRTDDSARLFSASLNDTFLGWKWQTRYRRERSQQDLTNIFDPSQPPYLYARKEHIFDASAGRDFGKWLTVDVFGGYTQAKSQIGGAPYDNSFKYVNGSSYFRPTSKLTLGFRSGFTDNLVGATLQQALSSGNSGSTTSTTPQSLLFLPAQAHLTIQTYNAQAQYALTNDLRFQGDLRREAARAPTASGLVSANSTLDSAQVGVSYSHRFRLWQFQSQYAVNDGKFEYGTVGTSRSFGQRGSVGFTVGSVRFLELSASVQGSAQDLHGATNLQDRSWGGSLTAKRDLFRNWHLEANYSRDRNDYNYTVTNFRSNGQGMTLALLSPFAEFTVTHQIHDGLTFQADPRLQFLSSTQAAELAGAFPGMVVVPSSADFTNATLGIHPITKLIARASWLTSRQTLNGSANNTYREWQVSAGYQFRYLTMEFGYVFHNQDFGLDSFRRNRIFFRISRDFKVLE